MCRLGLGLDCMIFDIRPEIISTFANNLISCYIPKKSLGTLCSVVYNMFFSGTVKLKLFVSQIAASTKLEKGPKLGFPLINLELKSLYSIK